MIDWASSKTEILLNPRLPLAEAKKAFSLLPTNGEFTGHIWLMTSGTSSSEAKYTSISKKAFLASAQAVNHHLQVSSNDIWINPLPHFHVGGLGILARSYVSGMQVVSFGERWKWDIGEYLKILNDQQGTISSLVPTQIYDIVSSQAIPPPSLRAVLVGGGHLTHDLYHQASNLGWKLLPSYGMTETASTIALPPLITMGQEGTCRIYPDMQMLPHIQLAFDDNHQMMFKGDSLFTSYAFLTEEACVLNDPKINGWFLSEDRGALKGSHLQFLGRGQDFVKIGGESVELPKLRAILIDLTLQHHYEKDVALIAIPDNRLGHYISLVTVGQENSMTDFLVEEFQKRVMPFEKIRRVHYLSSLPRSALGKLLENQLLSQIV